MIGVLIADDHGIVRSGLRMLLERQSDIRVVGEAADGVEALAVAQAEHPDVAVLDVSMPRMTGIQAAREIGAYAPDTRVLLLSMHDDERYFLEGLAAGACGYVLKRAADADLIEAVRTVASGRRFFSGQGQQKLVREWTEGRGEADERADPARARGGQADRRGEHQSPDRRRPAALGEDRGVPSRQRAVKLGMRDRVELVRYAIRRGLVEP